MFNDISLLPESMGRTPNLSESKLSPSVERVISTMKQGLIDTIALKESDANYYMIKAANKVSSDADKIAATTLGKGLDDALQTARRA